MPRGLRALAIALAAATAAAAVAAVAANVVASARGASAPLGSWAGLAFLLALASPAAVGLFVALRRPGNRVAWILLAGPLSVSVVMAADGLARMWLQDDATSAPGAWALLVASEWPVLFVWPLALAFRFPDGRLPSSRWRVWWALAVASAAGTMVLIGLADPLTSDRPTDVPNPLPFGLDSSGPLVPVFWVFWAGLLVSLVMGALSLRARYRAGGPQERRQVLWLAYGAVLVPLWLGGGSVLVALGVPWDGADGVGLLLIQVWPAVAVAVAVTRHGLYGIDRLLSRTLVYTVLTGLLAATYAAVALLAGALAAHSALAASLATLAAAAAFRPVRRRVQAAVDRRFARRRVAASRRLRDFVDAVHGGRAEPEEVGAVVAGALGDPRAAIVFVLPESGGYADAAGIPVDRLPADGRLRAPIGRDDRALGVLLHSAQAPPDVLRAVLDEAAPAVELARLRVALRLQLAEVASSRERIAQAGYAERRRIERDLHDGAQQRLVTLGIVLRRLQRSLPPEARVLTPAFDAAVDEVAAAIGDLRTIAAGVRPPRLDEGLAAALADLARGAAVPVDVSASPLRAPPDVEAAAYFVACEALTNAVKHGAPTRVRVRISRGRGVLRMVVEDDGVGGASPATGTGLPGMLDRVAAHGGSLAIDSPPGAGTRIRVELPCGS